ncbi:Multidrug resistance protein MdtA precursor [Planctomycetes bacterium CA13]|uniref:Multidrug resistance protein MdtA n=1 Tax=Novipirellula herctigrandis TaxID=2527986 RepID=A0A5C5Z0I9_9BACT|nr:Multidrug resistance protein MdtA precursor [Planctomycetes bacterium CA13]
MKPFIFGCLAFMALPIPAIAQNSFTQSNFGQPSTSANSGEIRAENCMVKIINSVDVPAEVEGKLMELKFEEGATVAAGDILAIIDDTQANFGVELKKAEEKEALLNATNEVNLEDARNSEKLARAEAEAYAELRREGAIPFWELEKKRLEAERGKLKIEVSEMQIQIAKVQFKGKETEREMAEAQLKKYRISAPFDGFIETRFAQFGGWVQPGTPIAKLVQLDKLRVEGDIDALRYPGQVTRGTPVEVLVYREANSDNAMSLQGKIDFVSSEIDLRNRYRVWVEIRNQQQGEDWTIKPGMRAEIIVKP